MNCQACDLPLFKYDEHRVTCKNAHVWTLPEFADLPPTPGPVAASRALIVPARRGVPAWVPGAVLGAVALVVAVVGVLL
jgi:hypothetical protein